MWYESLKVVPQITIGDKLPNASDEPDGAKLINEMGGSVNEDSAVTANMHWPMAWQGNNASSNLSSGWAAWVASNFSKQ